MPEKVDRRVKRKENHYLYQIVCRDLEISVRAAAHDAINAADALGVLESPDEVADAIGAYARKALAGAWKNETQTEQEKYISSLPVMKEEVRSDGN